MASTRIISRRRFLVGAAATATGAILAACGPTPTATPLPTATKPPATAVPPTAVPTTAPAPPPTAAPPTATKPPATAAPPTATPAPAATTAFKEAPALAELVKAGKLPSVDKRLPQNPMVLDMPWGKPGKYGGTLRTVMNLPNFSDIQVHVHAFSPLHWINGGTGIGPGHVEKWEVSTDAKEWTLYLRKGIKWSDGTPFTSDDILFWWEDMCGVKESATVIPAWALVGGKPMEVAKVDDYTFKFKFAASAPLTAYELASHPFYGSTACPQPKHYMSKFHPKYNTNIKDFKEFQQKVNWYENAEHPTLGAWMITSLQPSQRMVLERNPYYWCVDKNGNQLPYIDKVDVGFAADLEVIKLQVINGQVDFLAYPQLPIKSIPLYKDGEKSGNYKTEFWSTGAGGQPAFTLNWNHPDADQQALYRKREFRLAVSHALNRPRVKKTFFYGLGGPESTGTVSPKTGNYNRSEEGKALFKQWREMAVAYDPTKAKQLLDSIGCKDVNNDGWREMPNGKPLKMIVNNPGPEFAEVFDMAREDWQAVGLNVVVNAVTGQQMTTAWSAGTGDVAVWIGGAPDGPDILMYPAWIISHGTLGRWAPLYGAWMQFEGTATAGKDADKPPRDRQPPWEKPPESDPHYRMFELYKQAIAELDQTKRDKILFDITKIHINEGPFLFGMVSDTPRIVIIGNKMRNVPNTEQIPYGGWLGPFVIAQPGAITYPEQYWIEG